MNHKSVLELEFSVDGMLKFTSHLEMQNFFAKLVIRNKIPVKFSAGFNPKPKISLPVPRNVGIPTLNDRARITLTENISPEKVLCTLQKTAPEEIHFTNIWLKSSADIRKPVAVQWKIILKGIDLNPVKKQIQRINSMENIIIHRKSKKRNKKNSIDAKPLIADIGLKEEILTVKVAYLPTGTIKPVELLNILGIPDDFIAGRVIRNNIYWE